MFKKVWEPWYKYKCDSCVFACSSSAVRKRRRSREQWERSAVTSRLRWSSSRAGRRKTSASLCSWRSGRYNAANRKWHLRLLPFRNKSLLLFAVAVWSLIWQNNQSFTQKVSMFFCEIELKNNYITFIRNNIYYLTYIYFYITFLFWIDCIFVFFKTFLLEEDPNHSYKTGFKGAICRTWP